MMVPLAGLEPALLAETDFESVASTNSATGARAGNGRTGADYTATRVRVNSRCKFGAHSGLLRFPRARRRLLEGKPDLQPAQQGKNDGAQKAGQDSDRPQTEPHGKPDGRGKPHPRA